jgi:hypothetical protein
MIFQSSFVFNWIGQSVYPHSSKNRQKKARPVEVVVDLRVSVSSDRLEAKRRFVERFKGYRMASNKLRLTENQWHLFAVKSPAL